MCFGSLVRTFFAVSKRKRAVEGDKKGCGRLGEEPLVWRKRGSRRRKKNRMRGKRVMVAML